MSTIAQDTFNRANASLNGATMSDGTNTWTNFSGNWFVSSNTGHSIDTDSAEKVIRCTSMADTADVRVSAVLVTGNQGVVARHSGGSGASGSCYLAFWDGSAVKLFTITNSTVTQIGSTHTGGASNDTLSVDCVGTTIRALLNGTAVVTVTNSTHTTGKAGLYAYADSVKVYDNWIAETAGVTPALAITTQPSTTASGYVMSPAPVVRMTTDGSTTDTGFTGNVTAALVGSGGTLYGTTTVAAVAGIATFSNLVLRGAGSFTLRFSASGVADFDSASFTANARSRFLSRRFF